MNDLTKTLTFVAVSGILLTLALFSHYGNKPPTDGDFELVGQPFYEGFDSSADATSLEVMSVDPESMNLQRFSVQKDKGTWQIPTHHNYPAEAAARLAETAASVMGISRQSLAGNAGDFAGLGVLDPLEVDTDAIDEPESIGKRITMRDANGDPLVDLIIGKSAGDVSRSELDPSVDMGDTPAMYYYVRRPDEQQVYKSLININLSTRFSDWIDPDLLRVNSAKIMRLDVDNYELTEERQGFLGQIKSLFKSQGDRVILSRESFTDVWNLVGLQPEVEELNLARIQSTLEILSELTIVGVRPKFKFNGQLLLTPDLKFNLTPEIEQNLREAQAAIEDFQDELEDRGFSLAGTQEKLEIASANGQLQIGTDEGVLYRLQIGRTVEGSEKEIEIGGAKSLDDLNTEEELQKVEAYQDGEKNRYVMISVTFDETLLGTRPVKPEPPVEPTRPAGYTAPSAPSDETEKKSESEGEKGGAEADANTNSTNPPAESGSEVVDDNDGQDADSQPVRNPDFQRYEEAMEAFENDKIEYELALTRSDEDLKSFEEKVEEGKKLVDELNQRFADWYYVVKGSNLRTLQLKRADVTQARPDAAEPSSAPQPGFPTFPNLDFPEVDTVESDSGEDGDEISGQAEQDQVDDGGLF